ncbi:hypothetical protein [Elizabethkingia anophelis]|uniref:hypothetical protein n=1 Tax=Elizabethkingia anophelis TaxID=1117645 RepID=UPI000442B203|nr:hypothetical protein [Elizabethkingia anophelis]CDN75890.1 hypothetical protein E18064_530012 [Elizabethkingia anophelis]CDN79366.1 hypothetical protein E27107_500002 [Elizabethkingia anophelis]
MNTKCLYIVFILLLLSCNNDYNYTLKNLNDPKQGYIINMKDHNTKLTIATLSGNMKFYFLKKGGEFYRTDSSFAKDSLENRVSLSTIKEYKLSHGNNFIGDSIIIKKEGDHYKSIFKLIDNRYTDSGDLVYEYYYDSNYKIYKIVFNSKIYTK